MTKRFGYVQAYSTEELDEFGPEAIRHMVAEVLRKAKPDWGTFQLLIEPMFPDETRLLRARLAVEGKERDE